MNKFILLIALGFMSVGGWAVETKQPAWENLVVGGGCFWCMESPFEKLEGVREVVSGYTGGDEKNPSYGEVSSGDTGHVEAIQISYEPNRIDYKTLLEVFWRQIDPTDPGGQFADRGQQYKTAIFYHDETQKQLAEKSKRDLERSKIHGEAIVTEIRKANEFYPAEGYHQDYYKKNPAHYQRYRRGSGREGYLREVWGGEDHSSGHEEARQAI